MGSPLELTDLDTPRKTKNVKKNAATADILKHRCNCSPIPSDCIFTGFHNMTALLSCVNGISFPIKPRLTTGEKINISMYRPATATETILVKN